MYRKSGAAQVLARVTQLCPLPPLAAVDGMVAGMCSAGEVRRRCLVIGGMSISTKKGLIGDFVFLLFFPDFLGRLQPSTTTIQKTLGTP